MRERLPLFAGLLLLAAAIVVGSVAIAGGIRDRSRNDVITVTGSAKQRIVSDYAVWDASITSTDPSPAAAAARLAGWTEKTLAFLTEQGVAAEELTLQPVATQFVSAESAKLGGGAAGYQLTRSIEVRSERVAALADVAEAASTLLAEGIPLSAQPLQYVYTRLPELRPRLLAAALKDAQERGRALVTSTGARLGRIRSVAVGVFQVTSPNSTQVSDYGVYDTATLRKDVTAVVNVTFALE